MPVDLLASPKDLLADQPVDLLADETGSFNDYRMSPDVTDTRNAPLNPPPMTAERARELGLSNVMLVPPEPGFLESVGLGFRRAIAPAVEPFGGVGARIAEEARFSPPETDLGGAVGRVAGSAAQAATFFIPGMQVPALTQMASQAAGGSLKETEGRPDLTETQRALTAVGVGVSEAATEKVGMGAIGKMFSRAIGGAGGTSELAKAIVASGVTNIGEEEVNLVTQNAIEVATGVKTMPQAIADVKANAPQVAADAGLMGVLFGGAAAGVHALMSPSAEPRPAPATPEFNAQPVGEVQAQEVSTARAEVQETTVEDHPSPVSPVPLSTEDSSRNFQSVASKQFTRDELLTPEGAQRFARERPEDTRKLLEKSTPGQSDLEAAGIAEKLRPKQRQTFASLLRDAQPQETANVQEEAQATSQIQQTQTGTSVAAETQDSTRGNRAGLDDANQGLAEPTFRERIDKLEADAKREASEAIEEIKKSLKGNVLFSGVPIPPGSEKLVRAVAKIAAAKMIKGGIKASDAVQAALKDINVGIKQVRLATRSQMARMAKRLSESKDFDAAIAEMDKPAKLPKMTKPLVRKVTGQTDESKLVSEKQALKAGLKKSEQAAKAAATETRRDVEAKARERMNELAARNEQKAATEQAYRDEVAEFVQKYLPKEARTNRILSMVAKAKSFRRMSRALKLISSEFDKLAKANEIRRSAKYVGKPKKPRTGKSKVQKDIETAVGIKPIPSKLAKQRVKPSKLAPEYRDAVAPLVESMKNQRLDGAKVAADFIQAKTDAGRSNTFSDEEIARLTKLDGKSMAADDVTADDIRLATNVVRHIAKLSENERTAFVLGKRRDMDADAQTSNREIEEFRSAIKQPVIAKVLGRPPEIHEKSAVRRFFGDFQRDVARLASLAAGGRNSVLFKYLYLGPVRADSRRLHWTNRWSEKVEELQKKHGITDSEMPARHTTTESIKLPDGRMVEITPNERWNLMGHWRDSETRQIAPDVGFIPSRLRGIEDAVFRLDQADVDAILATSTPFEKDLLDAFMRMTNGSMRRAANRTSVELDGFERFIRTDHFSRTRDLDQTDRNLKGWKQYQQAWPEDLGILKGRQGGKEPIILHDGLTFADRHIHRFASYIEMAQPVRSALVLMGRKDVSPVLSKHLGRKWVDKVERSLHDVSGMSATDAVANSYMRTVIRNFAVAKLWGRISSAMIQITGNLPASMELGIRDGGALLTRDIVSVNRLFDTKAFGELKKFRPYFADRFGKGKQRLVTSLAKSDIDSLASTKAGHWWRQAQELGLTPIMWMDSRVAVNIYLNQIRSFKRRNPSATLEQAKKWAARRTEDVVRLTQNATRDIDHSVMARRARTDTILAGLTVLQSQANKMNNMLQEAYVLAARKRDPESIRKLAAVVVMVAASAAIAELFREFWRKQKEGFKEPERERTSTTHLLTIAAEVGDYASVGGGNAIRAADKLIRGERAEMAEGTFASVVNDITTGASGIVGDIYQMSDDDPKNDRFITLRRNIERLADGLMTGTGTPGYAAYEHVKGLEEMLFNSPEETARQIRSDIAKGKAEPAGEAIFTLLQGTELNKRPKTVTMLRREVMKHSPAYKRLGDTEKERARGFAGLSVKEQEAISIEQKEYADTFRRAADIAQARMAAAHE